MSPLVLFRGWTALAAVVFLGIAPAARAGEFVRADCQFLIKPTDAIRFDTDEHLRWYKRFWTGTCDRLSFCFPGSPNWNDIVGKLLVKGGPTEQPTLLPKACRLGQLIGLEWARDKGVQKISTKDLKLFNGMLEAAGDPLKGVEAVETRARAMTGLPARTPAPKKP
ncbi:hypothetical protein ASD21_07565 [Caulobacter sp. Root1455]|nr:hypothetical protein ASD38_06040 [Caulobacter sp. Root487D2Y]KQY95214.1 hypothetical protein ASD21_07565 [Caulobacter sp. Root1455]